VGRLGRVRVQLRPLDLLAPHLSATHLLHVCSLVSPNWAFNGTYALFTRHGDCHLVVSPRCIALNTANAEVIRQITQRREHFPKNLISYDILRIFGENVVTTESTLWRMHRRVTAATFNEKNSALVFTEAIAQAQTMLDTWIELTKAKSDADAAITSLEQDTMRLALHIIGYVGLGLRLLWPGQELPTGIDPRWAKYGRLQPAPGYTMSFVDAMVGLMDNIIMILIAPQWLMSKC